MRVRIDHWPLAARRCCNRLGVAKPSPEIISNDTIQLFSWLNLQFLDTPSSSQYCFCNTHTYIYSYIYIYTHIFDTDSFLGISIIFHPSTISITFFFPEKSEKSQACRYAAGLSILVGFTWETTMDGCTASWKAMAWKGLVESHLHRKADGIIWNNMVKYGLMMG